MHWLAICPLCTEYHQKPACSQPAAEMCWHPLSTASEAPRQPGRLIWVPIGTRPLLTDFTIRHAPASLDEWPDDPRNHCEIGRMTDQELCGEPVLSGTPLCRKHATLVPFHALRDWTNAVFRPHSRGWNRRSTNEFSQADAFLLRQVRAARAGVAA